VQCCGADTNTHSPGSAAGTGRPAPHTGHSAHCPGGLHRPVGAAAAHGRTHATRYLSQQSDTFSLSLSHTYTPTHHTRIHEPLFYSYIYKSFGSAWTLFFSIFII
jgi:hypothetical protein